MNKLIYIFFGLAFLLLTVLQLHNIWAHPYTKGFDNQGHLDYITLIKNQKRVPLANEGWGMFQAPLYYIFASVLPDFKSVQVLNFFYWCLLLLICSYFLNKTFKDSKLWLLGTFLIGSLPVVVYLTPLISNELFAGMVITTAFVYYCLHFKSETISKKEKIIFGILVGLSFLAKATGVFFFLAILIDQLWKQKWNILKVLDQLWIVLFVVGIISGWFYIRNIYYFGNPFILNIDFLPGQLDQLPGFRDFKFFTDLSGFFTFDLFHAHWYSLWAGTYFSWYFDAHNAVVPIQPFSKAGNILYILTIPLFILSVIGFIKTFLHFSNKNSIYIIYSIVLFLGFLGFTLRVPFYSSVRSTYLVSLVIPWCYFVLTGFERISKKIPKLNTFLYMYLLVYLGILIRNFWIR